MEKSKIIAKVCEADLSDDKKTFLIDSILNGKLSVDGDFYFEFTNMRAYIIKCVDSGDVTIAVLILIKKKSLCLMKFMMLCLICRVDLLLMQILVLFEKCNIQLQVLLFLLTRIIFVTCMILSMCCPTSNLSIMILYCNIIVMLVL